MSIIRCEWGLRGVEVLGPAVKVLIIVDVLSFSTAVDIATARGAAVLPFPSGDRVAAHQAAGTAGAVLAAPRRAGGDQVSLSPQTLVNLAAGSRIMLPSPNGSRLSAAAGPCCVFAACLRNARAVAEIARVRAAGGDIGIVPAGEQWPDGTLRPAIEDWLGAGAVIDALGGTTSAEATVAKDSYRASREDLDARVRASVSGQELLTDGFAGDVSLAVELNRSPNVPVLIDGTYRALGGAEKVF